mmetsp:Transcript_28167/g.53286  ORF Transcript_28167/g.53286 Transcript_28167/m.53286 type:complete len:209 (+) Transcript_28167:770-1396(+)
MHFRGGLRLRGVPAPAVPYPEVGRGQLHRARAAPGLHRHGPSGAAGRPLPRHGVRRPAVWGGQAGVWTPRTQLQSMLQQQRLRDGVSTGRKVHSAFEAYQLCRDDSGGSVSAGRADALQSASDVHPRRSLRLARDLGCNSGSFQGPDVHFLLGTARRAFQWEPLREASSPGPISAPHPARGERQRARCAQRGTLLPVPVGSHGVGARH